ncbi:hypothetical protein [Inquilinus limosus]|uniref:hypothetical protein n=1 Tax=Inquilinus limosus TaxID=171674 RepID=UPI0012DD69E9|nr:hypothetical protein [Inquilinus limosus]
MATRSFSISYAGRPGDDTFSIPVAIQGTVTVKANGSARAFTQPDRYTVLLNAPLVSAATITISGITEAATQSASAPRTPINPLTVSVGGSTGNTLGAMSTQTTFTNSTGGTSSSTSLAALQSISTVTDNSGGTSGTNTIAAVTDIASAANAIATLAAKLNTLLANYAVVKNSITSLGDKANGLANQSNAVKNSLTSLGNKVNEIIAATDAAGITS